MTGVYRELRFAWSLHFPLFPGVSCMDVLDRAINQDNPQRLKINIVVLSYNHVFRLNEKSLENQGSNNTWQSATTVKFRRIARQLMPSVQQVFLLVFVLYAIVWILSIFI